MDSSAIRVRGWEEMNRNQCNSFSGTDHTQHITTNTTHAEYLQLLCAYTHTHNTIRMGCVRASVCVYVSTTMFETQMINILWNLYLVNGICIWPHTVLLTLYCYNTARVNMIQCSHHNLCIFVCVCVCNLHLHRPATVTLINKFAELLRSVFWWILIRLMWWTSNQQQQYLWWVFKIQTIVRTKKDQKSKRKFNWFVGSHTKKITARQNEFLLLHCRQIESKKPSKQASMLSSKHEWNLIKYWSNIQCHYQCKLMKPLLVRWDAISEYK